MPKVKVCYIDDDCDTYLSSYLSGLEEFDYSEIYVDINDTFETILSKIENAKCQIAILDSKLYKDHNVKQKITGQELELLLAERYPYIFTVIISQNEDIARLNYFGKYKSSPLVDNSKKSKEHYDKNLKMILDFAKNKISRAHICYDQELSKDGSIDKMTLENIESLLSGNERVNLTKKDIDDIVELLGKLKEYEN